MQNQVRNFPVFLPKELQGNSEKWSFGREELMIFPDPDDLDSISCGVCYSCVQGRHKCVNPCEDLNKLYRKWYKEVIVPEQECPGCESGVDFHGAHLLDGELHPNCCSREG